MREHFDDALVVGWEPLDGTFGLPDHDDEHMVAAAVIGGAGPIATDNLEHFTPQLIPRGIQVLTGREFAANTANTVNTDPERAARALCVISARRRKKTQTPRDLLDLLVRRYAMNDVAETVLPVLEEVVAGVAPSPAVQ